MPKVLVVDDSALMRRLVSNVLSSAGYDVDTARNGAEGIERVTDWQPDVVTLDVNMPEMDGITALSLIMQARPTPVIMLSSLTEQGARVTFEALALGAVDYIPKPGGTISLSVDDVADQLLQKVRAASRAKLRYRAVPNDGPLPTASARSQARASALAPARPAVAPQARVGKPEGLVLIGVSTGGPRTLEDILPALPAGFPWPVLVAQHMPANFTTAFARRMDSLCALRVRECSQPLPLEAGHIYIAQGGTDMVVSDYLGRLTVKPRPETPGHPWHPSVDVMVDSALQHLPASRLIGVQLTGMGNDGARAMAALKRGGGRTIAESERSAVVFGMPQELIAADGATLVLDSHAVARQLLLWAPATP